jgi:hypothetical protein
MSFKTGRFNPDIRSTRDFLAPIDLESSDPAEAKRLADVLHKYGMALVRSPAFDSSIRRRFIKAVQDYFLSSLKIRDERLIIDIPDEDLRREQGFQYGPTPMGEELALCSQPRHCERCRKFVDRLNDTNLPFSVPGSGEADRKGRFMAQIITKKSRSKKQLIGRLNGDSGTSVYADVQNITPAGVSSALKTHWHDIFNDFGMMMLEPATRLSGMLARGLDLPEDYFTRLMHDGHHKIAPTFASYYENPEPGSVQGALHQDIDMFAIHARGTHPGLYVYSEAGRRLEVRIPRGCLLVQTGRQLYLKMRSMERAGEIRTRPIRAGWHEVVTTREAVESCREHIAAIESILSDRSIDGALKIKRIRHHYRECLRISCTFFYHFGNETELVYGLEPGKKEERVFPEGTTTREYIGLELGFIRLSELFS